MSSLSNAFLGSAPTKTTRLGLNNSISSSNNALHFLVSLVPLLFGILAKSVTYDFLAISGVIPRFLTTNRNFAMASIYEINSDI